MPRSPRIALADDLTGAAEVAAAAYQAGWSALVLTRLPPRLPQADVLVLDLNTRLARPAAAARIIAARLARFDTAATDQMFLKFDSVLRGPVLAQLAAAVRTLGRRRALLVPANPSLGRILHQGDYSIAGRPLHETAMASDPIHPRTSSNIFELLGTSRRVRLLLATLETAPLPTAGVLVGEASTAADIEHWARTLPADTLPAGAADFFRAWLGRQDCRRAQPLLPDLPTPALLLHGTTATTPPADTRRLEPDTSCEITTLTDRLLRRRAAVLAPPVVRLTAPDTPRALGAGFARAVVSLRRQDAFRHLLVSGGATAAAVLPALGWSELAVAHVWAPGVVTLRPREDPELMLTLKPGSYPWPDNLRKRLPDALLN